MKRLAGALGLSLIAGIAAAKDPQIGVQNQSLSTASVRINRIDLPQAGQVAVKAPNAYGNAAPDRTLGETHLSAGQHGNVTIQLDSKQLKKYGYTKGVEKTAFIVVQPAQSQDNAAVSTKSIQLRTPDPVSQGS